MTLAIFDLDNTLLGGDSDYQWGQFLVDRNVVAREEYEARNLEFYEQYKAGTLDIMQFLDFALAPLASHDHQQLLQWRDEFIEERIRPLLLEPAHQLLDAHRAMGHTLLVITATNQFVTDPIVRLYGIEHLIATVPEFRNGRYTGRVEGIPSFQHGKVERLSQWMQQHGENLQDSWFYSDSCNDLPLLKQVSNAVAVDPDDTLRSTASESEWPVISLREQQCDPEFMQRLR